MAIDISILILQHFFVSWVVYKVVLEHSTTVQNFAGGRRDHIFGNLVVDRHVAKALLAFVLILRILIDLETGI